MAIPYILNSRGEQERFSVQKVYRSARRVGASAKLAQKITEEISSLVYTGIKSSDIFKEVKRRLRQESPPAAMRFSLKEAMRALGPTGFPFEKYISCMFRSWGWQVKSNQIMSGRCCSGYEIDFTAEKDGVFKIGECKYRNLKEGLVQIEVALANYARFLDLKTLWEKQRRSSPVRNGVSNGVSRQTEIKSFLVTNTRFTSRAIQYCECVGVEMLGWNYPKGQGLERLVDNQGLYPVTILPSFKSEWGNVFSQNNLMLVKDLLNQNVKNLSAVLKIPSGRLGSLLGEARILLNNN